MLHVSIFLQAGVIIDWPASVWCPGDLIRLSCQVIFAWSSCGYNGTALLTSLWRTTTAEANQMWTSTQLRPRARSVNTYVNREKKKGRNFSCPADLPNEDHIHQSIDVKFKGVKVQVFLSVCKEVWQQPVDRRGFSKGTALFPPTVMLATIV